MTPTSDTRPNPDSLLAAASQEGRGRLKIFLGAAPGVGKTYAMLSGAKRLVHARVDVVVGVVETHGRMETEALLEGWNCCRAARSPTAERPSASSTSTRPWHDVPRC